MKLAIIVIAINVLCIFLGWHLHKRTNKPKGILLPVELFGAIPDGETDCYAAIQMAIDVAEYISNQLERSGTVFLRPGTYLLNSQIIAPRNVDLRGDSKNTSTIKYGKINQHLSSAELKNLAATPVELVAAPGPGKRLAMPKDHHAND